MLKPADIARELAHPVNNAAVAFAALLLFGLLKFAFSGGILGLFLAFLVIPGLFRYLMRVLESRAKGQDTGPFETDDFLWLGNAWSIFAAFHVVVLVYTTYILGARYGLAAMLAADTILAVVIPASLAVLAITRSPLECLNPRSVSGLIGRCGVVYWILPTYLVVAAFALWGLNTSSLPQYIIELIAVYLIFAFFALTGGVVRPYKFFDEITIHEPIEPDQEALDEELFKERTAVLNHAYGFMSRDNRTGGFRHIASWLERDPDPEGAWQWFLDQMLQWEKTDPALLFAQTYLTRLLHDGDYAAAVKVMTRCRFISEKFLPLPDDLVLAREAAEHFNTEELLKVL